MKRSPVDQEPEIMDELSIAIELIFSMKKVFRSKAVDSPVQSKPFWIGLQTEKIGTKPFPGATLKNISMVTGDGFRTHILNEYSMPILNPGERDDLWLQSMTLPLEGTIYLTCDLVPLNDDYRIITSQRDPYTGEISTKGDPNQWETVFIIQGQTARQQIRTNTLLLILTFLILLEAVVGIRTAGIAILRFLRDILFFVGGLIGKLAG